MRDMGETGIPALEKFKMTLAQAKKSPFYARRLKDMRITGLEDIEKLPFTTKEDMRNHSAIEFLAVSIDDVVAYHESFGTTGIPTPSWLSVSDLENYSKQINESDVNFRKDDIVLVRFPYAISVPAHIVQRAARKKGACVIPASSRTFVTPHTRVIKLMRKLKVTVLTCLSFETILLAETAKLMGYEPTKDFENLRAICTAGDLVTTSKRRYIEELWGVKVFPLYGTTETGNLSSSCEYGNMHASTDHFFFEVVDPMTKELTNDKGELVVTTLTREAMPLIRYRTGDIVKFRPDDECLCGRRCIIEHYGRIIDAIQYDGRRIWLGELEEAFLSVLKGWIDGLWIVIVHEKGLNFRIESEKPERKVPQKLTRELKSVLKVPIKVELKPKGAIFDRRKLLEVHEVIKPRYVVDWTKAARYPCTLDEVLFGYHTFVSREGPS